MDLTGCSLDTALAEADPRQRQRAVTTVTVAGRWWTTRGRELLSVVRSPRPGPGGLSRAARGRELSGAPARLLGRIRPAPSLTRSVASDWV